MVLNLKRHISSILISLFSLAGYGQALVGTTGLLYMPTADMQKDKTFLLGGNYLNTNHLSDHFHSKEVNSSLGLKSGIHAHWYMPIMVQTTFLNLFGENFQIKTVPFMEGYAYGKKGGGRHGLLK